MSYKLFDKLHWPFWVNLRDAAIKAGDGITNKPVRFYHLNALTSILNGINDKYALTEGVAMSIPLSVGPGELYCSGDADTTVKIMSTGAADEVYATFVICGTEPETADIRMNKNCFIELWNKHGEFDPGEEPYFLKISGIYSVAATDNFTCYRQGDIGPLDEVNATSLADLYHLLGLHLPLKYPLNYPAIEVVRDIECEMDLDCGVEG